MNIIWLFPSQGHYDKHQSPLGATGEVRKIRALGLNLNVGGRGAQGRLWWPGRDSETQPAQQHSCLWAAPTLQRTRAGSAQRPLPRASGWICYLLHLHFVDSFPIAGICKPAATLMNLLNNVWVSGKSKGEEGQTQGSEERLTHLLRHSSGSWTEKPSKMPISGKYCGMNILVTFKMKHLKPRHKNNVSCPCHW